MNLYRYFQKMNHMLSMRKKIVLSYVFLILIPVCFMMYFYYMRTSEIIEKGITNSILQSLKQTEINISFKLDAVENLSDLLFMNNNLHTYLARDDESTSMGQKIDDTKELREIVTGAQNSRDVFKIRLFVSGKKLYAGEMNNFFPLDSVRKEAWYASVVDYNGRVFWRNTGYEWFISSDYVYVISCMRMLRHPEKYDELAGILSVDIPEKNIYDILSRNDLAERQSIFITDRAGVILSHADKSRIGEVFLQNHEAFGEKSTDEGIFKVSGGSQATFVIYTSMAKTGWKIVAQIPVSEINRSNTAFSNVSGVIVIVMSLIIFMLALFLFAAFLSEGMNKRIKSLVHTMEKEGIESIEGYAAGGGDIYKLEKSFEGMIKTVKKLAEESVLDRLHAREAELKALQAQINPHFLYNTLDIINWMAIRRKAEDISAMVDALARYFRYSLSKGKDIVSISDEIELVEVYLAIQKKRFGDIFTVDLDIDAEAKGYRIPKLILQPVIENAILHGIQERNDAYGRIRIEVKKKGDEIVMAVEDNGLGIKEKKLDGLLKSGMQGTGGSYGLYNIHERIRLFCGEDCGIGITSKEGEGTRVEIRLKAVGES